MKRIAASGGVVGNTSSRLHEPRNWLTTTLDITRTFSFHESSQALFQILLPQASASRTSSHTSTSNMRVASVSRPAFTCTSSSFNPVLDVKHRAVAVVLAKLLPVNLGHISPTQLTAQCTHVQAWADCSGVTIIFRDSCTAKRRVDLHRIFVARTGWLWDYNGFGDCRTLLLVVVGCGCGLLGGGCWEERRGCGRGVRELESNPSLPLVAPRTTEPQTTTLVSTTCIRRLCSLLRTSLR